MFDVQYKKCFVCALHPVWQSGIMFGPAFTCKGQKILQPTDFNDTKRITMLDAFTEGCIQVLESDNEQSVALYGNISGLLARKFGAVGAVIDGPIRDATLLEEDKFPVFCKSVHPVSALYKWQITEWQTPIRLNGIQGSVMVNPNDYIFGDSDGVIVIPANLVDVVCDYAEERAKKEKGIYKEIARASTTDDILKIKDEVIIW